MAGIAVSERDELDLMPSPCIESGYSPRLEIGVIRVSPNSQNPKSLILHFPYPPAPGIEIGAYKI
jgi:hypothetical protein